MTRKDRPGLLWRKSRHSNGSGSCVEAGQCADSIVVCDSKLGGDSPVLAFPRDSWRRLVSDIKHDQASL